MTEDTTNQTKLRKSLKAPLSVGTLQWGTTRLDHAVVNPKGVISETTARCIIDEFTSHNVTLWDTAEGYGGGTCEKRLGRLLSPCCTVMTKFLPVPWRHSHACFERAVRNSCKRLNTNKISVYLLHSPVHWRPIEYWVQSAAICKQKGLIDSMGLSNCNASQVQRAVQAGKEYGIDVVLNQVHYSLLDYNSPPLREMERVCKELQVAIVAYSPIGQGLLTDALNEANFKSNRVVRMLRLQHRDLQELRRCVRRLALEYNRSMTQVALNWCICHDTIPLVGCRSLQQAKDSLGALGWTLDPKHLEELDQLALDKSTLSSPPWRRALFVILAGILMTLCWMQDVLGYGMIKEAMG